MVIIDGNSLSIEDLISVSRNYARVALSHKTIKKLKSPGTPGRRKENLQVPPSLSKYVHGERQTGIGPFLPLDMIRGTMLIKANELARGLSDVTERTLRCLIDLLNKRIHPAIPAICPVGIYGESGYLSYLTELIENGSESDLTVLLLQDPEKDPTPERFSAKAAWKTCELEQFKLEKNEKFALSTGNCMNIAAAGLLLNDVETLSLISEAAAAMSAETLMASRQYFHKKVQGIRGERGQSNTAKLIRNLTTESQLIAKTGEKDPYSISCIPQTSGTLRTLTSLIRSFFMCDLNAVTLGRAIVHDPKKGLTIYKTGNFHSLPTCLIIDFLKEGLAAAGILSEKRISRLINPEPGSGLPPDLVMDASHRGGFRMCQYLATGLAAENVLLAQPGILDSSATYGRENDFSPLCTRTAIDGFKLYRNVKKILAIEYLTACQGMHLRIQGIHSGQKDGQKKTEPLSPGTGTLRIYNFIRTKIPHRDNGRFLSKDLKTMETFLDSKGFLGILTDNF